MFTLSYLIRYVTHFNPKWICRSRISMNFTKYISTALLKNPSENIWKIFSKTSVIENFFHWTGMDWFLYDNGLCHERVNSFCKNTQSYMFYRFLKRKLNEYFGDWYLTHFEIFKCKISTPTFHTLSFSTWKMFRIQIPNPIRLTDQKLLYIIWKAVVLKII